MKQDKGITLITLIMYIILTVIVIGILGALSRNFRGNLNNVNSKTAQEVEYDKLNTQLLKETKTEYNFIDTKTATENSITFTNGNTYKYVDEAVILNDKIEIAANIKECIFILEDTGTEQTLTVKSVINDKTQITNYVISKNDEILPGQRASENTNFRGAIIPKGFTLSKAKGETSVKDGLVIYLIDDKTDEEINSLTWTDTELENLRKTYDQFVWVPISHEQINNMFICQAKTGSNGNCNITVENGAAKCTVHNSTQMAGRLYATTYGQNFKKAYTEVYTANTGLREPDVVTLNSTGNGSNFDGNKNYLKYMATLTGDNTSYASTAKFKETLQTEYNEMVTLIYNTGGYYVGRYETSNITTTKGTTIKVVAGTSSGMSYIYWYYMYAQQKTYATNKNLANIVKSSMMFGSCYDQMLEFVNVPGQYDVTKAENVGHSFSSFYSSGSQSSDMTKNIYDLEGNLREWTTEAYDTGYRISRGRLLC